MFSPLFLTRASIGLAATAIEKAAELPVRAVTTVASLPAIPIRLAGGLVQTYLHMGQALTGLAIKGDQVIASVVPPRSDQPEWATFDEDNAQPPEELDVDFRVYGSVTEPAPEPAPEHNPEHPTDPGIPSGRVSPRLP